MSMTDPIADLLTRMRNAGMAKHETVDVPWSRLKEGIMKVLVEEGYVGQIRRIQVEGQVQDTLRVHLKYGKTAWAHFACIRQFGPSWSERGSMGIHIHHYAFDRALFEAQGRIVRAWHRQRCEVPGDLQLEALPLPYWTWAHPILTSSCS